MLSPTLSAPSRARVLLLPALTAAALSWSACAAKPGAPASATPSSDAWATVDGREITRDDVDKAYRRALQGAPPASQEEELASKLSLLNDLIIQDLLLAKARTAKIEATDAEIDKAFAEGRKNIPEDAFQQELAKRNLTTADMREGVRRELLAQKVMDKEVTARIVVSDKDVSDFFNANRAQFNLAETAYHVAQIVVTPGRDPQLNNRTGDDATTPEGATRKAQMLMERLKSGVPFGDLAADYSEDPQTAPRGGDLGFIPTSALNQAPAHLREVVLKSTPGTVSAVSAGGVHALVLLVAKEAAGQRDLSDPSVRDGITSTLRGRKEQLLRTAFLSAVRSDATVVNYVARKVLESPGELPAFGPKAPGAK